MNQDERQLITGLFDRLRVFGQPEKDRDADTLISQSIRANPNATYMLVQSVLVQENALEQAQNRIQDLEARVQELESSQRPAAATSKPDLGVQRGSTIAALATKKPRSTPQRPGVGLFHSANAGLTVAGVRCKFPQLGGLP